MSAAPPVSIGLPVYNGENYMGEAISSLLEQDYGDFELLIADNASTDSSLEIARQFATDDPRVIVYPSRDQPGRVVELQSQLRVEPRSVLQVGRPRRSTCAELAQLVRGGARRGPDALALLHGRGRDRWGRRAARHAESWSLRRGVHGAGPRGELRARQHAVLRGVRAHEASIRWSGPTCWARYTSSDRTMLLQLALLGRFHQGAEAVLHPPASRGALDPGVQQPSCAQCLVRPGSSGVVHLPALASARCLHERQ